MRSAPDRGLGEPHAVNRERRHRREAIGGEHERGSGGPHEQGRRVHTRTRAVARSSPRTIASSPVTEPCGLSCLTAWEKPARSPAPTGRPSGL